MIEVKELLAPCATIFALLFAVFAFLLPQAIRLGSQTRSRLSKVEVPDSIRQNWRFTVGTLGHSMLLGLVALSALLTGAVYCPLIMHEVVQYYLGSQTSSANEILSNFNELTQLIMALSIIIVVAALAMLTNDLFISQRYPTLLRAYIKRVLDMNVSGGEVSSFLPEAHALFKQKKYLESVLYSTAALEYAIRGELGVSLPSGWGTLTDPILHRLGSSVASTLQRIGYIRDSALHPTPKTSITREESKDVLDASSDLIKQLEQALQQEREYLASAKGHPKPRVG